MSQVLLIQFRASISASNLEAESISRELGHGIVLVTQSALDETLAWDEPQRLLEGIDGVIFGGSGDFYFDGARDPDDPARSMSYVLLERLHPLIEFIFEHNTPTLGICYGHQLLGAFKGVVVSHDTVQQKTKSHEVRMLAEAHEYFLCSDVPRSFKAQYAHKDVLTAVPEGATLIMEGGECCRVSALSYSDRIFSTQFHPELNLEDLKKRLEAIPDYLPEGKVLEEVFEEAPDAHAILRNFGRLVLETAK
jgi:GMP synthase-like glutamine amidotransferase